MARLVIELTNRCNLRCQHCFAERHAATGDLPLAIIDKVLAEGKGCGIAHLAFTGGGPTIHRQFAEITRRVGAAGYTWSMVSNGHTFPQLYPLFLQSRQWFTGVTFSLDGAREATHDRLRGKGSYRHVMRAASICAVKALPFTFNPKTEKGGIRLSYAILSVQTFACLVLGLCMCLPDLGHAATFTVDDTEDREDRNPEDNLCNTVVNTCTLRAAIEQSNSTPGDDVINLPAGQYVLTLGQLVIEDNLTIRGEGAGTVTSDGTIIGGTIIDGNKKSRVLMIDLDLLVCDSFNDSVLRYGGQTGRFIEAFVPSGSGGLNGPLAAEFGPGNDLFVGGLLSGVHRYNGTTGAPIKHFPTSSSGAPLQPTDLVFDTVNLFVTDFLGANSLPSGSILRFDAGTDAFIEFIPPGLGGLASPNSLALGPSPRPSEPTALYVTNVGPNEVLRYSTRTGEPSPRAFVFAGSGGLRRARDLAFGPDENLYVASELNDRILRYDGTTGAFIDTFVSAGSGGLDGPTDLAFGPDGSLYVISHSSGGGGVREVLRYDGTTGAFIEPFIPAGRGGLGSAGCLLFASGIGGGPTVNISGVTIQNGFAELHGGGIFISKGSTLSLNRSIVNGNRASPVGSISSFGGGIFNEGRLDVTASTITRNDGGNGGGGGIRNSGGRVTLESSTVDNNTATGGGGTGDGGIENVGGTLTITNSTISGNKLTGGQGSRGGGIRNIAATLNLLNVTIANNSVATSSTALREGGGINNGRGGPVNLTNTIIDGNSAQTAPDCFGTLTSGGFNLIRNTADCDIKNITNSVILRAELAPLADNGGLTRTHALCTASKVPDNVCLGASPAIDKGDNAVCPSTDQREFRRPIDGPDADTTATCDIGAFEFGMRFVNNAFSEPTLLNPTTSPGDTTGCPPDFFGKFSFNARFTNTSINSLSDLLVEVQTITNGNVLQNADGGPGGVKARLTVPRRDGFSDGLLSRGQFVNIPFVICLRHGKEPFTFNVDVLGIER